MFNKFIKYVGNNFGNPNGIGGKITTKIMNIINQNQYKVILENIKLEQNNNVLDIGFGNGYLIKKLLRKNIPINIYGIEISNDMLNKVSQKNRKNIEDGKLKLFLEDISIEISNDMLNKVSQKNRKNIADGKLKLFLEDISKTSFEDNTFDKIYTVNSIYFWNEMEKCFSEIRRILKPNGIFFNVLYTKEYLNKIIYTKYGFNKYSVEEIIKMTKENGMAIIETIEIKKNKSYCIISGNKKY